MKHKDKVKLARKLRTRIETKKKTRVSIFQTEAWTVRKARIAERVKRKIELAKKRAKERREKRKNES